LQFNFPDLREKIIHEAAKKYGYDPRDVEIRLYVGKFKKKEYRDLIANHIGKNGDRVFGLNEVVDALLKTSSSSMYCIRASKTAGRAHENGRLRASKRPGARI
jgi:hypothetical protein